MDAARQQQVIEKATALRLEEPRRTARRAADEALRDVFGLAEDDGVYGTSEAADAMGFSGHDENTNLLDLIVSDVALRIATAPVAPFCFEFAEGEVAELAIASDDVDDILEALADLPVARQVAERIATGAFVGRYRNDGDLDPHFARKIARALFEGGREAADEEIESTLDAGDFYSDELGHLRHSTVDGGYANDVQRVLVTLEEAGVDEDDLGGYDDFEKRFREAMGEILADALADADDTSPTDIIPSHVRVEVVSILRPFGEESLGVDEVQITDDGERFVSLASVNPGPGLQALIETANHPYADFLEAVAERFDLRLDAGPEDAELVNALAASSSTGRVTDDRLASARDRAAAWAEFAPRHDPSRQPAFSMDYLLTVLEEASYGGVPVVVARIPLKELIEHDFEQPMVLGSTGADPRVSGGYLGIVEPSGGSGHIERMSAPVTLPAGRDQWRVSGEGFTDVDNIFQIVGTAYYASATAGDIPEFEAAPNAPRP